MLAIDDSISPAIGGAYIKERKMERNETAENLLTIFCYFYDKEWEEEKGNVKRALSLAEYFGYRIVEDIDVAELWHCINGDNIVCSKYTTDEECTYEYALMKV